MKKIFFLFFFLCFSYSLQAQKTPENSSGSQDSEKSLENPINATYFLSLEKPGRIKRVRFYVGDELTIKFKGSKKRVKHTITKIKKDTLELSNEVVDLQKIEKITLYSENGLLKAGAKYLPIAGLLFFLGDMINPVFSGKDPFQIRPGSIIFPGILIGSGLILKVFEKRTLKLNKNRYLKILEKF